MTTSILIGGLPRFENLESTGRNRNGMGVVASRETNDGKGCIVEFDGGMALLIKSEKVNKKIPREESVINTVVKLFDGWKLVRRDDEVW